MKGPEKKRWLAVYTKPRWEKKVHQLLRQKGIEAYCPLNKVHRKWSDRIKMVEEPLFKSYVFVKVVEDDKSNVRMTSGVVNFVYWLGKPAIIKEREIEIIQKFLNEYTQVVASPVNVQPNTKVRINGGAFMDKEGVVKKLVGKKVEVIIESIGYSLTAYIEKTNISVVDNKQNGHSLNKKA